MFGEIAPRYDLLNHLLSMGTDVYWRWRTVRKVAPVGDQPILDLCTGTGDLAIAYWRAGGGACRWWGPTFAIRCWCAAKPRAGLVTRQAAAGSAGGSDVHRSGCPAVAISERSFSNRPPWPLACETSTIRCSAWPRWPAFVRRAAAWPCWSFRCRRGRRCGPSMLVLSQRAAEDWASAGPESRRGVCISAGQRRRISLRRGFGPAAADRGIARRALLSADFRHRNVVRGA